MLCSDTGHTMQPRTQLYQKAAQLLEVLGRGASCGVTICWAEVQTYQNRTTATNTPQPNLLPVSR
jgi:hypothetical protein